MRKIILIIAFFLAIACEPEIDVPFIYVSEEETELKSVSINIKSPSAYETKSSFNSEIENKLSSCILAVYDSQNGNLVLSETLSEAEFNSSYMIWLPMNKNFDFYVLANLWKINTSDLSKEFVDIPMTRTEMEEFTYRLDGGTIDGTYRRETFEELSIYGLPMSWSKKNVNSLTIGRMDIILERLFSKLVLKIDHSGIAGTSIEAFVNGAIKIKQVNNKLSPFLSSGSKALSTSDILPVGDYESAMENALVKEFVFYVPENMQGELMPGNTDPWKKDIDGVDAATGNDQKSKLSTYLEFTGDISSSGISTKAIYRFFLGTNATSNFDIARNELYNISLSFNAESLFVPEWKIETRDFSDTRQFYLSGTLAGKLPEGKDIVVRKNREAKFDLNLQMNQTGGNKIGSCKLVNDDYQVANLGDFAWTSDCYSATHSAINEPQRVKLNEYGIDIDYSNGSFTVKVVDDSKFREGITIPITFTLFPGKKKLTAIIKTMENIGISEKDGKSLNGDFYLAQKRSLEIKGFNGNSIYYAANQKRCGNNVAGFTEGNYQWKPTNSIDASFPTIIKNGSLIVYPYQRPDLYADQKISNGQMLDIYAFRPNDFTNILSSGIVSYVNGTIYVCSEDILNDDLFELSLKIEAPFITKVEGYSKKNIYLDGENINLITDIFTIYNNYNSGRRVMTEDEFEKTLYDYYLKPQYIFGNETPWGQCISVDNRNNTACIKSTTIGSRKIEDELSNDEEILSFTIANNPNSGLYSERPFVYHFIYQAPTLQISEVSSSTNYFNSSSNEDIIQYKARVYYRNEDHTKMILGERGPKYSYDMYGAYHEPITELKIVREEFSTSYWQSIDYIYREKDQPKTYNGKSLLGGLAVPYGHHQFVATIQNKWDGRKIEFSADYDINYELDLYQYAFYWENVRYAGILMLPNKNIAYLKSRADQISSDNYYKLLQVLGTNKWNQQLSYRDCYRYEAGLSKNILNTVIGYYQNFDVKFYNESSEKWTKSLMEECANRSNYLWLNNLTFHNGSTETSDEYIIGNSAISRLRLKSEKKGCAIPKVNSFGDLLRY